MVLYDSAIVQQKYNWEVPVFLSRKFVFLEYLVVFITIHFIDNLILNVEKVLYNRW